MIENPGKLSRIPTIVPTEFLEGESVGKK